MIHAVWGTKNREAVLTTEVCSKLFNHIKEYAKSKEIFIDTINGHLDHVHCLFGLGTDQNISKVLQLIKGESSHWMNQNQIVPKKFSWADEYFAVSVSESQLPKVRDYIRTQEEHHRKITFAQEYDAFVRKHGFETSNKIVSITAKA